MNFKKSTSLFLALYLLVSTSGLAFNVHYCGDEIAAISSVFDTEELCDTEIHSEEKTCCNSSLTDHNGCCSDETIQADFDDVVIKQLSFDFDYVSILQTLSYTFLVDRKTVINNQLLDYYCDSNAPPLFKLHSQFVFYA